MGKKWYNLFVTIDQAEQESRDETPSAAPGKAAGAARSATQTIAEIASAVAAEPKFTAPVSNPTSFDEIYQAAEIRPPTHGYTVFKVAEMLQSEHIRNLPPEVKRSSILVALDAAGVKLREIIEDAVRRDRALDTYEHVQQKALEELEAHKNEENRQIEAEIERLVSERRARIQSNNEVIAKEKDRFYGWQLKKQQEEQRIAEAVSYFAEENPITTSGGPPPSSPRPGQGP
ncbi:MAG: hypothetical protein HY347_04920 [candidate division NC10 bacterium]|nr:hypothetical protein [candidate division NC10 bacterium]